MKDDIPDDLLPALRQYRGNNRDEFVFGFDQAKTIELVENLKAQTLKWHDALTEKPDCSHFTGSSESVLVVRDCGDGTLESYAISKYREEGWGDMHGSNRQYKWLDQEVMGYRVVKWANLGPSKDIKVIEK